MQAYLDCNATTRPLPEVVAAMAEALEHGWANPSSVHRAGIDARRRVELARESVARLVGASEREIVFTSGGTEAAGLAIAGRCAPSTAPCARPARRSRRAGGRAWRGCLRRPTA